MERAQKLLLDATSGLELLEEVTRHYAPADAGAADLHPTLRRLLPTHAVPRAEAQGAASSAASAAAGRGYDYVLELHSRSGAGKTHLIYLLCIDALLAGHSVIIIDADGKFDCSRLLHLLRQAVAVRGGVNGGGNDALRGGDEALRLLDYVHILQPQSAAAAIRMLDRLPDVLAGAATDSDYALEDLVIDARPPSSLGGRRLALLAIDSISAFHWHDPGQTLSLHAAHSRACGRLATTGVCTSWDVGYTYLALPKATSTRLAVERKEVLQFTQGITQAYATADARQEVLARGIFYVKPASSTAEQARDTGRSRAVFAITPDSVAAV